MAGSAVALATILAAAQLRAPIAIDAWLAITENNIGPRAYRPQEVVRAMNGTTIQVIHTDAEGRMALADTLALAARRKPRAMIDFATLTGACVYALTERMSGLLATDAAVAVPPAR
jgi:leucyl aminopeptidase